MLQLTSSMTSLTIASFPRELAVGNILGFPTGWRFKNKFRQLYQEDVDCAG